MTARRVAGVFLALAGAVGVTASAYLDWFSGRSPDSTPINRLFEDSVTEPATSYWTSVAMPLAAVTALAVLGLLVMSRLVLTIAWLLGVATLVLHVLQQVNDEARLAVEDVQTGVWVVLAGLFVMLLGLVIIGGRRRDDEDVETVSIMEPDPKETWYALSATAKATPSSSAAMSIPAATPGSATTAAGGAPSAPRSESVVEPPPKPTPEPGPPPAPGPEPAPPPGPDPMPMPGPTPAPAPGPEPAPGPAPEPSPDREPGTPPPDEPGTPAPPDTGSTDKPPRRE